MSGKTTIHLGEAKADLDRKCEAYGMGQSAFIRFSIRAMPESPSLGRTVGESINFPSADDHTVISTGNPPGTYSRKK